MRVGTIYYNENTDTTQIKCSDGFIVSDWVLRMDVLGDAEKICLVAMEHVREQSSNDNNDGYLDGSLHA